PMVETLLSLDSPESGSRGESDVVAGDLHVAWLAADFRVRENIESQRLAKGDSFLINGVHQSPDRRGHAFLVEEESAGGSFDLSGVQQRHRRVDDRVAVLKAGLKDIHRRGDEGKDVADLV